MEIHEDNAQFGVIILVCLRSMIIHYQGAHDDKPEPLAPGGYWLLRGGAGPLPGSHSGAMPT